jgi:hypothetical protein
MKPFLHARNSARKHGGIWEEYLKFHEWLDQTKSHIADMRHRAVLHNSFGIYLLAEVFGGHFKNSDGHIISVRDIGEDHVLEDLGSIPSLSDCLKTMPLEKMDLLGARGRKRTYRINHTTTTINQHD